jgi:hypothetical protein
MATDINDRRYNEFRAADAFEFVEVVHRCMKLSDDEIEQRRLALAGRTERHVDTLLLAAYRAYEWAQIARRGNRLPEIVKLNDAL